MSQPHATTESIHGLTELSAVHRVVRRNAFCTYCGIDFSPSVQFEEEHVVGWRFVPKGTLAGNRNLVLRACGRCNDIKSGAGERYLGNHHSTGRCRTVWV